MILRKRHRADEFTQTVAQVFNGETVKKRDPEFFTANNRVLLKGLKRVFEHIGGVPPRLKFDNPSTAVVKVLEGGERESLLKLPEYPFPVFRYLLCFAACLDFSQTGRFSTG